MTGKPRPRVLLADDYAGILTALQRLLEPACEVVGSVTDGSALIEAARRLQPDVIVVDVAMPEINGLDACHHITRMTPHAKVVVLTAAADTALRQRAFSVGASAFVLKSLVADDLLPAIRRALSGSAA
jgi:DNA-binding NarL/FixJ family response regulator